MISANQPIESWHAHVYFDASSAEQATALCESARDQLPVQMGRVHRKRVGPHPMWSCQLAFAPGSLETVLTWLVFNRAGLTVFAHPNTDDALRDHRDHAVWLGASQTLKLGIFKERT